jgi:GNAT superfamily N-acetyltransferase
MSCIEVRRFHRRDRDQLTGLVNAHAAAVVPGMGVSVATVLNQLEREPGEFIVDPWVSERVTLVAEQQGRVAAAALLLRYSADDRVSPSYRGIGDIRWLLFWPEAPSSGNPYWSDATEAAEKLIAACTGLMGEWGVTSQEAGGELPVPGVYGVPEQWPHIRALYERAGFRYTGHTEVVYLIKVEDLPRRATAPLAGMQLRRSVGINGTRLSAVLGGDVIGYVELEIFEEGERLPRHGRWADVGNLHVAEPHRRYGVATWLLGQAGDWLRLAQVERLLDYAWLEGQDETGQSYEDHRAFITAVGFIELTRTQRGWTRLGRDGGGGGGRDRGEQGAGPVAVAILARVEVVAGELAGPGRDELRADLGDRQVPLDRDLVDDAVHAREVRDAHAADDPPEPRRQRQVEQHGLVGDRVQERPQVGEEPARGAEQDVVDAGPAGDEVGLVILELGHLLGQHVAHERAGDREVDDAPVLPGGPPELGYGLAHVAAMRARRAQPLRGGVAQGDPERAGLRLGGARSDDPLVVRVPVGREREAVLAHLLHAVGPAAQPARAHPGDLGIRAVRDHRRGGREDLNRRLPAGTAGARQRVQRVYPGRTGHYRRRPHSPPHSPTTTLPQGKRG